MGGSNPYLQGSAPPPPKKKYKIYFENTGTVVEVDPAKLPYGDTGRPGSILDIALAHGQDIDHACGGVVACSTCHVYVKEGIDTCPDATDEEQDMLDLAPDLKPNSRLGCQCVPDGSKDVVVQVPEWNRNNAREGR